MILVFIPTDEQIDAMQFKATAKLDADQQKADLKAFLGSAKYLKDHRGEYYERNSDRMSLSIILISVSCKILNSE